LHADHEPRLGQASRLNLPIRAAASRRSLKAAVQCPAHERSQKPAAGQYRALDWTMRPVRGVPARAMIESAADLASPLVQRASERYVQLLGAARIAKIGRSRRIASGLVAKSLRRAPGRSEVRACSAWRRSGSDGHTTGCPSTIVRQAGCLRHGHQPSTRRRGRYRQNLSCL